MSWGKYNTHQFFIYTKSQRNINGYKTLYLSQKMFLINGTNLWLGDLIPELDYLPRLFALHISFRKDWANFSQQRRFAKCWGKSTAFTVNMDSMSYFHHAVARLILSTFHPQVLDIQTVPALIGGPR